MISDLGLAGGNPDESRRLAIDPSWDHSVQFCEDDRFLCGAVARFVGEGLLGGQPVLVIATPDHWQGIQHRLRLEGCDVAAAQQSGRLSMLDARATLDAFMVGDAPDWGRFRSIVGAALERSQRALPGAPLRAYGEMVDLLWRDRNPRAALRLEEFWNDLQKERPFSLLCTYLMKNFASEADGAGFHDVCLAHAHVFPSESYREDEVSETRRRRIGALQQRALALENEIAHRRELEWTLREALSERKRTEEQLKETGRALASALQKEETARREAEVANRTKDEFLATLSHELRTPLGSILGWAQRLRTQQMDALTQQRAIHTIERNAKLQAQLIEDVLDVSSIIAGKLSLQLRDVSLAEIIRSAAEVVRPMAEAKRVKLLLELGDANVGVVGDTARLQQVFWNLLSNAIKFTSSGGSVAVALDRSGPSAHVRVSDTGEGISADVLPYIFDRFRQADGTASRSPGGLGLGLSIVRHIVEAHGGTATASSEGLGQGARFDLLLPAQASGLAPREEAEKTLSGSPPSSLAGLRVLLVDDEVDGRDLMKLVLEQRGADVEVVGAVGEALDSLRRQHPDVLVSDIGLPGQDGFDLIRQVRALPAPEGGGTPAIALTAYSSVDDRNRATAAGFQIHISKPVDPNRLIEVIAHLAGRSAATQLALA